MTAPLAEFADYDGLVRALRAVREHRDLSLANLDEISGMPDRYSATILAPRSKRRIGLKCLGDILGGLGVKCLVVTDPEALARVKSRYAPRDKPHLKSAMHTGSLMICLSKRHMARIQSKGGAASWAKLTPKQRSKKARKMARARWRQAKTKVSD